VLWLTQATVERCDNFAHPGCTNFSRGIDASLTAALQVAVLHGAVGETPDRRELRSCIQRDHDRIKDLLQYSLFVAPIKHSHSVWYLDVRFDGGLHADIA
jgi:hypothetical protein